MESRHEGPTPACRHCGWEIENRGTPTMDGPGRSRWVHIYGMYTACWPQRANSPVADPED